MAHSISIRSFSAAPNGGGRARPPARVALPVDLRPGRDPGEGVIPVLGGVLAGLGLSEPFAREVVDHTRVLLGYLVLPGDAGCLELEVLIGDDGVTVAVRDRQDGRGGGAGQLPERRRHLTAGPRSG